MEGEDKKQQLQQKSREGLKEKGIDIDKKVTPDEARVIVYKLAVQLWGDDYVLIKKNLRKVAEKAMKMFETDREIDNPGSVDSVNNVTLVASVNNAALVNSHDLGRGKRKRIVAKFGDFFGDDGDERDPAVGPSKKQRKQSPSKNKNMKPNSFRFRSPAQVNSAEPSPMPECLRAAISKYKGQDMTFVIEKELTESDMKSNQSRLLIPLRQVKADFLNERERQEVTRKVKITVKLVEPTEMVPQICLNMWEMRKSNNKVSYSYVLISSWNEVKDTNNLHENDVIQVWAFRTPEQELGIALAKLPPKQQSSSGRQD